MDVNAAALMAETGSHDGRYMRYTSEASLLNWAPGLWPKSFVFQGETYVRHSDLLSDTHDRELIAVRYVHGTKIVTVFND